VLFTSVVCFHHHAGCPAPLLVCSKCSLSLGPHDPIPLRGFTLRLVVLDRLHGLLPVHDSVVLLPRLLPFVPLCFFPRQRQVLAQHLLCQLEHFHGQLTPPLIACGGALVVVIVIAVASARRLEDKVGLQVVNSATPAGREQEVLPAAARAHLGLDSDVGHAHFPEPLLGGVGQHVVAQLMQRKYTSLLHGGGVGFFVLNLRNHDSDQLLLRVTDKVPNKVPGLVCEHEAMCLSPQHTHIKCEPCQLSSLCYITEKIIEPLYNY